jgi:heme A synthase
MISMSVHLLSALLALATLAAVASGMPAAGSFGSPGLETAAAVALYLQFAALSLVWLVTAPFWRKDQGRFRDAGWPPLRSMAWLAPLATLGQISLGAAYRYGIAGVIPHVTWAFAAAIVLILFGAYILTQEGVGAALKRTAAALAALTGLQVVLGVMALLYRVAKIGGGWMEMASRAHMGSGATVLGLSVILAAFVLRCAEPASRTEPLASNGTSA